MKKFLTLLGSLGLVATASMAVVSCQVQIQGDTLKNLSDKFNEAERTLVMANPSLSPKELHNQVIQLLTRTLVDDYGMDKEGFFATSDISTITIGTVELVKDSALIQPKDKDNHDTDKLDQASLTGEQATTIVISGVTFTFKLNISFAS